MKRFSMTRLLIAVFIVSLLLTGCGSTKNEGRKQEEQSLAKEVTTDVKVAYVDGIPALSMAKLAKENPSVEENYHIEYELIKGSDLMVAKVLNGEVDIAIVPSNLAATVYNKTNNYQIASLSGFGNLYIMTRDELSSIEDLKGKEITTIGKGLTPDIVFQYVLKEKGIDPEKDVTINYLGGATELAPAFLSKKADIILAPEPMITTILSKDATAHIAFGLNDIFGEITGMEEGFPQTVFIVKKELAKNHKAFLTSFLSQYEEGIQWAKENPADLGEYATQLDITVSAHILDQEALKRMNLQLLRGAEMEKIYLKYAEILFQFDPKTLGGKIPDGGIFIER